MEWNVPLYLMSPSLVKDHRSKMVNGDVGWRVVFSVHCLLFDYQIKTAGQGRRQDPPGNKYISSNILK